VYVGHVTEHRDEQRAGPYVLVRRLGAGGMAEVFEAVHRDRPDVRVALKRVSPEHAGDPSFERMFDDEIAIARRIVHENVLAVVDAHATEGERFLALELADGVDGQRAQRAAGAGRALSARAVAYVGARVARGLHAAHEATDERGEALGVIHRDVSPANVFLLADGRVKLGDFGVAFARDRTTRTATGVVKGKVSFMAPEQLAGLAIDRRADVFSLGCTLHALATGVSPIRTMDDLAGLVRDGQVPLSDELDPALRPTLARAMCPLPSGRFESALAFAAALDSLVDDDAAARDELREHVRALRDEGSAKPMFDALWSLDGLGLDEPPIERTSVERPALPQPTTTTAPPEPSLIESEPERPRARRVTPMFAAIALSVLFAGTVIARFASRAPVAQARAIPPSITATRTASPNRDPVPRTIEPAALPARDSGTEARVTIVEPHGRALVSRRRTSTSEAPPARTASETPANSASTANSETGTAWLRVGFAGAAVAGARVWIDGVDRGWAPARVRVAPGTHRVVVRASEGAALLEQSVLVAGEHTSLSPRTVLVPAR
jgi:serine/threonine protein kinase